jgi:hypothetical protein
MRNVCLCSTSGGNVSPFASKVHLSTLSAGEEFWLIVSCWQTDWLEWWKAGVCSSSSRKRVSIYKGKLVYSRYDSSLLCWHSMCITLNALSKATSKDGVQPAHLRSPTSYICTIETVLSCSSHLIRSPSNLQKMLCCFIHGKLKYWKQRLTVKPDSLSLEYATHAQTRQTPHSSPN